MSNKSMGYSFEYLFLFITLFIYNFVKKQTKNMFKLFNKMPNKVYVLYKDCVQNGNMYSGILGVYKSYHEALRHFSDERAKEIKYWENESIEHNGENYFYAYKNGDYCPNHCILTIEEKEILTIYNNKNKKKENK